VSNPILKQAVVIGAGLQYTHTLMRLAAEDAEADKILAEVRSLLKPQSALLEPELTSRVMSMMAPA
jgi:hypothetical protein